MYSQLNLYEALSKGLLWSVNILAILIIIIFYTLNRVSVNKVYCGLPVIICLFNGKMPSYMPLGLRDSSEECVLRFMMYLLFWHRSRCSRAVLPSRHCKRI